MALFDQLSGLLGNVMNGNLSEQQTHEHYDQIAQSTPPQSLGAAIGSALGGLDTGEVQQRVANSANQMSPQQRGGVVDSLLGGLGASGINVGGLLSQLGVNQNVASNPQSATPDEVAAIAAHAHATNPGLLQDAMAVYAAHPTLVKALGDGGDRAGPLATWRIRRLEQSASKA